MHQPSMTKSLNLSEVTLSNRLYVIGNKNRKEKGINTSIYLKKDVKSTRIATAWRQTSFVGDLKCNANHPNADAPTDVKI